MATKALVHPAYTQIANLQILCNYYSLSFLIETNGHIGDNDVYTHWSNEINSMCIPFSQLSGNIKNFSRSLAPQIQNWQEDLTNDTKSEIVEEEEGSYDVILF